MHYPPLDNQGMILISAEFCPLHRETTATQHELPPATPRPSGTLIHSSSYEPRHFSLPDNQQETHYLKYEHFITKIDGTLQKILLPHFI